MNYTFPIILFLTMVFGSANAQLLIDPSLSDSTYNSAKLIKHSSTSEARSFRIANDELSAAFESNAPGNDCFIPSDETYNSVPRNDDGSFGPVALPFSYNLYGNFYNQIYINTNGNITFTSSYSSYTASGFPISIPMVAAYWADIDTRNSESGQIHYKVSSTNVIVTWDSVGYYSNRADLRNTFQIIITDGTDPIIGEGNNTAFYYQDQQWATSGTGFGGNASTVGINKGNSENFIQIGRFSINSLDYDGPGGENDGINYLDYQCFPFNVTDGQNIPPSLSGLQNLSYTLNTGDSLILNAQYIGPEVGQTVNTIVNYNDFCNISYDVTNGTISKVKLKIIADTCNIGTHIITLSATDDGTPTQIKNTEISIIVSKLEQTISFDPPSQSPNSTSLKLTANSSSKLPVSYSVLSGPGYISGNFLVFTGVGYVNIRASQIGNGIYNSAIPVEKTICSAPSIPGSVTGKAEVCINSETNYSVANINGATFDWAVSSGNLTSSLNTATILWDSLGTHSIFVKYTAECGTESSLRTSLVNVVNRKLEGSFSKMLPSDGNVNLALPLNFSWFPLTNVEYYDLFIWPATDPRPSSPTFTNITSINFTQNNLGALEFGRVYKWQIIAKSICDQQESPVQTFRLRYLPDLIITNIQIPSTGFSGQNFSLQWEVKNTGLGGTLNQQWKDKIYLSTDTVLDQQDIVLGTSDNVSELLPSKNYIRNETFVLPQGINDNYYVIVVSNASNELLESNNANNQKISVASSFIQLTPPPDLQVSSVVPPNFAFSGQDISLTWKVDNYGTGQSVSSTWTDNIYFSKDSILNISTATRLGSVKHEGLLLINQAYSQTKTFTLPEGVFGVSYFYVVTDFYNQVYEHAKENNNTRRSEIVNVILTPPIDLVATQVTVPLQASNNQLIAVKWRVENNGGSATENRIWVDEVFISKSAVFHADSVKLLARVYRPSEILPGEGYDMQATIKIPEKLSGDFYIYVFTDAQNAVFEYTYENNNKAKSNQKIQIYQPDLTVPFVTGPASDTSGNKVNISWEVINSGPGNLYDAIITDRILISSSSVYNAALSYEIGKVIYPVSELLKDSVIKKSERFSLPNGIAGNFYIFLQTDINDKVFETSNINNVKRSLGFISITLGESPDLQIASITTPDTVTAGDIQSVSFKIINKGIKKLEGQTWTDRIFISAKAVWDSSKSILLKEMIQKRTLAKDSFYVVDHSIKIPASLGDSAYYFYVFTDANKNIYEHTGESNNIKASKSVFIKKYPPVDLVETAISIPDSANSGNSVNIQWTVMNKGLVPTIYEQWTDALYLSTDTIFDNSDKMLKEIIHRGHLNQSKEYTTNQSFVIPNGISGNYYLLLVADHKDIHNDANRANNYRFLRKSGTNIPKPIIITLTPPADLTINKLNIPDEGTAGQPVPVKFSVKNIGAGKTPVVAWVDKIYLSTDLQLDEYDQVIGSYVRNGILSSGQEYSDSIQVFLPANAQGNYALIFKTDANDNVYEHGNEANTTNSFISITKAPLSDLVVSEVILPPTAEAGEQITILWKVKNQGENPAKGFMKEGVYLSIDTVKDANDMLLSSAQKYIVIPAGEEMYFTYTGDLKGVSLRDYYAIIHTDILNNISESIDSNNTGSSIIPMTVTVPELVINETLNRNLLNNKEAYYKIEVPPTLNGESLLISLKGDSLTGANEIYLKFNEVPSRAIHDFANNIPYQGNQEIIVSELKPGIYYLMIYGNTTISTIQSISLTAKILNFEIRKVEASKGGNSGQITLQIQGSKLGSVNKILLKNTAGTINADKIEITDPTKIFATFKLIGANTGIYDLVAENMKSDTTSKKNAFTIISGGQGHLLTNVITPPNTRPSNIITISVQFTNDGNADLVNPVLKLSSLGGAPIGFNVADLASNLKELVIPLQELNGPKGILRPGASGIITVYSKATTALGFMLIHSEDL